MFSKFSSFVSVIRKNPLQAANAALGYILYKGIHRIPLKSFFTAMSVLLIVMAAGLLAGGIHEFQELLMIPVGIEQVWSTKILLDQESIMGSLIKSIFGYSDSPNLVQVIAYWAYLIGAFYAYFKPSKLQNDKVLQKSWNT